MSQVQIKVSKNGSLIPILNGVYLHSMYNPEKEASNFIQNNKHQINQGNNFLILGLGFGYHIEALVNEIKDRDYRIYVLEPSQELIEAFLANKPLNNDRMFIQKLEDIKKLYQNSMFAEFLAEKPIILPHTTSFNMHQTRFKEFLNFRASLAIQDYKDLIVPELRYKFDQIQENWTLEDYLQFTDSRTKIEDTNDLLFLALNEIFIEDRGEV